MEKRKRFLKAVQAIFSLKPGPNFLEEDKKEKNVVINATHFQN